MPTTLASDLRRSRRLDIRKLVAGQLMPSGAPVKIRDIGFGGFALETSVPLKVGSVLDFRFTSKDGSSFVLKAAVAHSRRVSSPIGPVAYVSGLEFAGKQTPTGQRAIEILIEKVNWILSFYDEDQHGSPGRAGFGVRRSASRSGPRRETERVR
jgi:PilZ domain